VDKQTSGHAARQFAGAFAESLAESLNKVDGIPWRITVLDSPDIAGRKEQLVNFRLTLDGALRGECFVEFSEARVTAITSRIQGQPQSAAGDDHGEALVNLISSAMAGVSKSLSADYGEFTAKVHRVEGLAFGGMFVVPLAAAEGDEEATPVMLYFDGELVAALSAQSADKGAVETEKPTIDPVNLKLVMGVELNVSLRFGQRQMPLREVLELASGSVIELDRQVDDPVELLLDGKVIARGEAVIVDGNYGLRVTEIPQPIASHFAR
jgi:flagellar motor switch protein FliN/FliY